MLTALEAEPPATDDAVARQLGADGWAADGEAAAALIDSIRLGPPRQPE